jgi:uncharacterized membrane protein
MILGILSREVVVSLILRARRVQRFLAEQSFYPLLLTSLLAAVLLAMRVYRSESRTYSFLIWNLLLAWVPYLWSLWAASIHRRFPRRWGSLLLPGALWLLFLPNAPYLITDFVHLYQRPLIPLWYDIILMATFALAGMFLAVASLNSMRIMVEDFTGSKRSWLFVGAMAGLSGMGIYLGRVLRWNSWDVFLYPRAILVDAAHLLIHPFSHLSAIGMMGLFAGLLFVSYWMFTSLQRKPVRS